MNLMNWRSCNLGWPQLPGVFTFLPKTIFTLWWLIMGYIFVFSKSEFCLCQYFSFLGLFWVMVDMSVLLPTDKLWEIQQLALTLLQMQTVIVCAIIPFRGGQLLCHWTCRTSLLCCVIQSDMLTIYHSPAHLFCTFHFSFPGVFKSWRLSQLQQCLAVLQFPLPDVVICAVAIPSYWTFNYRVLVYPYCSVEPGQVLDVMFT